MTDSTTLSTVALIGLGHMASHIGRKLRNAGYPLIVWNRTASRAEAFAKETGAVIALTPRHAAERADVVLSSVSDDTALRAVMLGEDGALAAASSAKTFVETSTVLPDTQREIGALALAREASYIDAPISGSTPQIDQATAIILAGGEVEAVERVKPILATFSKNVLHFGALGSGATMKLCVNMLLAFGLQAVAEATVLGTRAGLDRDVLLDGLGEMAVISPAARLKLEDAKKNAYPAAFPVEHMAKDLRLALELAAKVGAALPATEQTAAEYADAAGTRSGSDVSAIIAHEERRR